MVECISRATVTLVQVGTCTVWNERSWTSYSTETSTLLLPSSHTLESGIAAPSTERHPLLESPEDGSRWPLAPPASLGDLRLQCLRC